MKGWSPEMAGNIFRKHHQTSAGWLTFLLLGACFVFCPETARPEEAVRETATHRGTTKIVVFKNNSEGLAIADALSPRLVIDYPDRKVYVVHAGTAASLTASQRRAVSVRDDLSRIILRDRTIDTTKPVPPVRKGLALAPSPAPRLYLIQFAGPIKEAWLTEVRGQGDIDVVTYLANNAYLIRANGPALGKLRSLVPRYRFMRRRRGKPDA